MPTFQCLCICITDVQLEMSINILLTNAKWIYIDVMWQCLLNEWMNGDGRKKYVYLEELVLWAGLFTSVGKNGSLHVKVQQFVLGLSFLTVIISNFQCKCSTKEANAVLFAV